jgi:AsmA protein
MKKLLIGLGVLIVVIIAVIVIVPFFIPLDTYKAKVVALVKDETGRDMHINGKVSFSLLPSLALEANDVTLSNPPGAASPDMLKLKTLAVKLRLLPLLHGEIDVDQFKLVQPVIDLEVDKAGTPNWVFKPAAKPAAPATPAAPAPQTTAGGGGLPQISLGDVSIVDGQATYLDQRTGAKQVLSNIDMQLSLPDFAGPFNAKGSATWNGEKIMLTAGVAKPGALQSGGTSELEATLQSAPLKFDFKGNATGATLAKIEGGTDLFVPSVRGLAKWLGVAFNPPGTGFGPLTISGKISVANSKMAFTNAALSLDAIKGTGAIAIDTHGSRPVLSGRLDIDKLDVNPYLATEGGGATAQHPAGNAAPPAAPAPQGAAPAAKSSGWSDAPLDLSPLKAADADFDFSANSILYRKIAIGKSALGLHLKNGRFEADLKQMALYQGKGQGKVVADGSGATPAIAIDFDLSGVAIQPLLRDAMDFNHLTGSGNLALEVQGHGKSQRDIVSSLDGKGNLNLANGKIEGVNLIAFMKNVASAATGSVGGGNETTFGSLAGTYTITNGILRNNDLKLTSPEIPMSGAGTIDLPRRQVDYKLTPSVAGLVAVPVDITGPWDNLSYRPDLAGVAKGLAEDPGKALDVLKGQGSGGGKGVGQQLLKGLLGK